MPTEVALPVKVLVFQHFIYDGSRDVLVPCVHQTVQNEEEAWKIVFSAPEIEAFRFGESKRLVYERNNYDTNPVYGTDKHYVGRICALDNVDRVVPDLDRRRKLLARVREMDYSSKVPSITFFVLTRGDNVFPLRNGDTVHDMHDLRISTLVGAPEPVPVRGPLRLTGTTNDDGSGKPRSATRPVFEVIGGTGYSRYDRPPGS